MTFYRFQNLPSFGDCPIIDEVNMELCRETPKGYWIKYSWEEKGKKWVSKTTTKRYAYPCRKQAWEGFKARKKRQLEIVTHQIAGLKLLEKHISYFERNELNKEKFKPNTEEF